MKSHAYKVLIVLLAAVAAILIYCAIDPLFTALLGTPPAKDGPFFYAQFGMKFATALAGFVLVLRLVSRLTKQNA